MMHRFYTICAIFLLAGPAFSQVPVGGGIIVNEINQGTGSKEFMEFLVLGDPDNPCNGVDLTGWVMDDNNGSFETCGTGVGIAVGHYRFTSCYNAVPPGSLMVVYNAADPYAGMPADDPTDADGDGVYIIPSTSTCLEANYVVPSSAPASCDYSGAYSTPTLTWASGMANSGDVAQVRKPDYSFFHGFSYGDVNTVFPAWPSGATAGNSFNKGSGNLALDCGSCWSAANYFTTTAAAGTPGVANTTNNAYFISNLKNCTLNYADLNDVDNCTLLLPIYSLPLNAAVENEQVKLSWSCNGFIPSTGIILHSNDGKLFDTTSILNEEQISRGYIAMNENTGTHYFQLLVEDVYGEKFGSSIVPVNVETAGISAYPNPARDVLHIVNHPLHPYASLYIINMHGETVLTATSIESQTDITIDVAGLAAGKYMVCLLYSDGFDFLPFVH